MAHQEDINGDDLVDLVLQVATQNLDPGTFQDGYGVLTGSTYDGQAIEGVDVQEKDSLISSFLVKNTW